MAFDSLVLSAVTNELNKQIAGAKINKIHQSDAYTLVMRFHSQESKGALLISAHPQNSRLHLTAQPRENPAKAPIFAMVLRKWLEGGRFKSFSALPGERIAQIELESRNELGDQISLRLVVEIMGKHSNIILLDSEGTIIDGIRRYGSNLSRYREVLPGRSYKLPPPQNKLPLSGLQLQDLAAALYADAEKMLADALLAQVAGLSPLIARHVALSAGLAPEQAVDELGEADFSRILAELQKMQQMIDSGAYVPTLRKRNGEYVDFAAIHPLCWDVSEQVPAAGMNMAVDALYCAKEARQNFSSHKARVSKQLRQHINRLNKKIDLQQADLSQCVSADAFRVAGDLLAANSFHLQKGASSAQLPSFENPEQLVEIELDPALTPQENVQRYYRRYAKAKKARVLIEQQLEINCAELDYLLSVEQALEDCRLPAELAEVEQEAVSSGYIHLRLPKGKTAKSSKNTSAALPPHRFISRDGFVVLVGRNNRQNDRLSLRQAADDDIWLHTQKIPGAHVIIESQGKQVPESTLLQAAAWAAWFSKARESANVPVDFVTADKLKKPATARPGFVIYSGHKTLYVNPKQPELSEVEENNVDDAELS